MAEGFTYDPSNTEAVRIEISNELKKTNKKIDMSLDDVIAKNRATRTEHPITQKKFNRDSRSHRDIRPGNRPRDNQKPFRKTEDRKDRPKTYQIKVSEEAIRKFLKNEGIKYDRDVTLKVMAYPNNQKA